ncbi:unnamed protein product, partial [Amoebophrya sp. A25]
DSQRDDTGQLYQGAMLVASFEDLLYFYTLELRKVSGTSPQWQLILLKKVQLWSTLSAIRVFNSGTLFALDRDMKAYLFQVRHKQSVGILPRRDTPPSSGLSADEDRLALVPSSESSVFIKEEKFDEHFVLLSTTDYSTSKLAYHRKATIPDSVSSASVENNAIVERNPKCFHQSIVCMVGLHVFQPQSNNGANGVSSPAETAGGDHAPRRTSSAGGRGRRASSADEDYFATTSTSEDSTTSSRPP